MSINEEDVKTYGLGQYPTENDPTTGAGLEMVPTPESVPSSTDQPANVGAPLPDEATGALGGGTEPPAEDPLKKDRGKPGDIVKDMDSGDALTVVKQTVKDLEQARKSANPDLSRGQAIEITNHLEATGVDVKKAGEQMLEQYEKSVDIDVINEKVSDKEGKKRKWAFRNVYNKIAPEEMGLFLIDFGLRAMMAGESMGTMGALGAAGSGALGALQQRREANEAKAVEDYKYGLERGDTEREFGLDERRVAAEEKRAETASTNAGRPLLAQWQRDFYKQIGYTDEQIGEIIAGGATPQELIRESTERLYKEKERVAAKEGAMGAQLPASARQKTTLPDGSRVPTADLTPAQIRQLARDAAAGIVEDARALREGQASASDYLNRAQQQ